MRFASARVFCTALAAAAVAACGHRAVAPAPTPTPAPAVARVTSPLNGVSVYPSMVAHRVAAVMVDNYPIDARPQSGLRDADIVYEVEAEGGITRYMALYLEAEPFKIGPVRSARLYFVDLARPYRPLFAHAGENDDVWGPLEQLREDGFADMEQIVGVPEAFWRDDSRDMPHNLYTSVAKLRAAAPNHGWPDEPAVDAAFAFAPRPAPQAAPDVKVDFWNGYEVRYAYDRGKYLRFIKGVEQHDLEDPEPYRVADVIAVWIPATVIDELGDLRMQVYGDFPAVAVRPGSVVTGRWIARNADVLPRLEDRSGSAVKLAPGQIYIEVLPQGGRLAVGKQTFAY